MKPINNRIGYVVSVLRREEGAPEEISSVVGKPRGTWETTEPMVIYNTVDELIAAVPDFNKKTHFICQVIVHLLAERVEIVSV